MGADIWVYPKVTARWCGEFPDPHYDNADEGTMSLLASCPSLIGVLANWTIPCDFDPPSWRSRRPV